jgi:transposase InsO family protein
MSEMMQAEMKIDAALAGLDLGETVPSLANFVRHVRSLGIRDHPTSPRSPWQNAYVERLRALPSTWSSAVALQVRDGARFSNHAPDIAAMDLFVVPTIGFGLLYALLIVRLDRRQLVWINVTRHPTAEWIARQLTEAFPWDEAPRYLIRDRDRSYGDVATRRIRAMGIRDKPIAPASPWQNGFAERLIGSIRRECVDHLVVWGEGHLRRILRAYARITTTSERTSH